MVRWTSQMLDATPHYCLRCEAKIREIVVSQWLLHYYLIRCPSCRYILAKLPIEKGTAPTDQSQLSLPPPPREPPHP